MRVVSFQPPGWYPAVVFRGGGGALFSVDVGGGGGGCLGGAHFVDGVADGVDLVAEFLFYGEDEFAGEGLELFADFDVDVSGVDVDLGRVFFAEEVLERASFEAGVFCGDGVGFGEDVDVFAEVCE